MISEREHEFPLFSRNEYTVAGMKTVLLQPLAGHAHIRDRRAPIDPAVQQAIPCGDGERTRTPRHLMRWPISDSARSSSRRRRSQ